MSLSTTLFSRSRSVLLSLLLCLLLLPAILIPQTAAAQTAPTLNRTSLSMYRNHMYQLWLRDSCGSPATWQSSNSAVASVDSYGMVRTLRHGTCTISATCRGVRRTCAVTVLSPTIRLSTSAVTLSSGSTYPLAASVSSGNPPTWSSSNPAIASVSSLGKVTGRAKGTCLIYAREDGGSACCRVTIR